MELFTPMLHAKMMPLLSQVYTGKINNDKTKLDEYGGQKVDAQIVPGGIRIAGISQHDLEYDPVLYRRDRGELDWDQRSMASTTLLDGASTLESSKSQYFVNSSSAKLVGYDAYMAKGPGGYQNPSDIEMTPIDIQEPLLSARTLGYQQNYPSQQTLVSDSPPTLYQRFNTTSREAPLHRPQERAYSPSPSYHTDPHSHAPRSTPTPTPGQHVSQPSQQWSAGGHGHPGRQQSQQFSNMVGVGAGAVRHQQSASQQWGNVSRPGTPVQGQQQWGNASRSGTPVQGSQHQYHVQHPSQQWQQQQPGRQGSSNNLAGRGAYRGY